MLIRTAKEDIERVLYSAEQIRDRVAEIGAELVRRFGDQRPIMVCVLKGASYFYIDLCRAMDCHIDMDFIAVSSYGKKAISSGIVRLIKDIDADIEGRPLVIVEDIIDSGLTLKYLNELFASRRPSSITTVTFLKKKGIKDQAFAADMIGFEIPDEFVVGYGLDYAGSYRNLPYIGILKEECYK